MSLNTGITIVKRFEYRGDPNEEWSNKYWLSGEPPASNAEWKALVDGLIGNEKTCYASTTKVTRAYAYNDDALDANSVWSYDYGLAGEEVAGTLTGTGQVMAGDQAGYVWWKTSRKTSRGKWIYLRKFFHDGFTAVAQASDNLEASTVVAYEAFANILRSGAIDDRVIQGTEGLETIQAWGASPYVTTRTLKRRGKRPLATP